MARSPHTHVTQLEFPALYASSDKLSGRFQLVFYRTVFWNLFFLVIAALLSYIDASSKAAAYFQALVLLGLLSCSVYLFAARPDRYWYAARAVAESIKTVTWRFVTKAEPFTGRQEEDLHRFRNILKAIVDQNKEVTQRLSQHLDGVQVTDSMKAFRDESTSRRLALYVKLRVSEQQLWYASRSHHNRRRASLFFALLIVTNAIMVAFAIAKVAYPRPTFWPIDVLVAVSAALLSWIQAKKYSEQASSYALAAHEISLIKEQSATIKSDPVLSAFVGDAENAFSREHTQWVARKDS
jgi:ABC-type multidrug transport system fused ATPase/permease subunit